MAQLGPGKKTSWVWDGNNLSPHLQAWLIARSKKSTSFNGSDSMRQGQEQVTEEDLEAIQLHKEAVLQMVVRPACGDSQHYHGGYQKLQGSRSQPVAGSHPFPGDWNYIWSCRAD